jgi:1,2-diacylglycerol 3-beta-glucosyltransferase
LEAFGAFAVVLSMAYFVAAVVVVCGTLVYAKKHFTQPASTDVQYKTVSIVVAARNEAVAIPRLLESLSHQDYPRHLWDVLVVDDRSTDGTYDTVHDWYTNLSNLHVMRVDDCPAAMGGKQHALAVGIPTTTGDIILMTDADCHVPSRWIGEMVSAFDNENVGFVAGMAQLSDTGSPWVALQRADLAHLLTSGWGTIALGAPMTAIGNNLALRRDAYNHGGGYASLPYTIAEDCAVVQQIVQSGHWTARIGPPGATVTSDPVSTIPGFLRQRARWTTGAFIMPKAQLAFLSAVFTQRLATLSVSALAAAKLIGWKYPVAAWCLWGLADAIVIARYASVYAAWSVVLWSPMVTLWQAFYHAVSGAWSLFAPGTISWKGSLNKTGNPPT